MIKKRFSQLMQATFIGASTLYFLTGCDSGEIISDSDTIDINTNDRGIDFSVAAANPATIASMPSFFLSGDTIAHFPTTAINLTPTETILPPTPIGSDHFVYRNLEPLGTITTNNSGGLNIHNLQMIYDRADAAPSTASWTLGEENSWPSIDNNKVDYLEGIMANLVDSSGGSTNTISDAFITPFSATNAAALINGANSIGLLGVPGPELVSVSGSALFPDPHVLMERNIAYTVTSTNALLTGANQIQGTYAVTDRLGYLTVQGIVEDDDGGFETFDSVTISHTDDPFFLLSETDITTGTFTITLNR